MNETGRVILIAIIGAVVVELGVYLLNQFIMDYYDPTNSSNRDSE